MDDNSPDGTAQEVRRVGQKGRLHPPDWPARLGLCGDRGRVISSAEYVAVIADIEPPRSSKVHRHSVPWKAGSCHRIDLIGPGVDDGFSVEVIEVGEYPRRVHSWDATRKRRSTDRAIFEKKPPTKLSQEPSDA